MKFAWQGRTHIITDVTPIVTFTGLSSATGTVSAGATITQSSSGASGTLLFDTASSDTRLHLKDVTGTFLTGSGNPISGAGTGYPTAVVSTHTKYDITKDAGSTDLDSLSLIHILRCRRAI